MIYIRTHIFVYGFCVIIIAMKEFLMYIADEILSSQKIYFVIFVLILILPFHIATAFYKRWVKNRYDKIRSKLETLEDIEKKSIDYYSKNQAVDIFRFVIYFLIIAVSMLLFGFQGFSVLAVAVGTFILILKEPIVSMISYLFLVPQYPIGSDIKISGVIGEVVRIKMFYTGLAGKEDNGEYNGKFYVIPNHLFFQSIVERQEIKSEHYRTIFMTFLYKKEEHPKLFKDWVYDFRTKLDELLPMRNLSEVGNYKSYAGVKYKLNYDYNDNGFVQVKLSFIAKPGKAAINKKEEIIDYIESCKVLNK